MIEYYHAELILLINLLRLGEGCSHMAALLFKVESAARLGYTAVTSQNCKWNETFTTTVTFV